MNIRQVEVGEADKASAKLFFDALTGYYDTSEFRVLDMFARDGQLTIDNYQTKVKSVDAWELMGQHEKTLYDKGVNNIVIGCSYGTAMNSKDKYDMVVIDTPQGIHTDSLGCKRVEHFSAILSASHLYADVCVLVLYVNKKPYNKDTLGSHGYDEYPEYDFNAWISERVKFYGTPGGVINEAQALMKYRMLLGSIGYKVKNVLMVPCFSDVEGLEPYAFRLGLEIVKVA